MFHPRTVLVTGGAGFIGSNLIRWILRHAPDVHVVNLDLLTYAGNIANLTDVAIAHGPVGDGRYHFVRGDITDAPLAAALLRGMRPTGERLPVPDAVLHLAAESHVDRSIAGPAAFVRTNVQGTLTLLEAVRGELATRPRPFRFINVSTDEVYGALGPEDLPFTERTPLAPNSPYAASKASADCLVRAYRETFGLPCLTTRCSNNYGPYQFPEKLIPRLITRGLADAPLPLYGDGQQIRDWLHVDDHTAALWAVLTRGELADEIYNIGGNAEATNLTIARAVLADLGKPASLITFVADRPGHDRRYAIDASRLRERLGWAPTITLETGLAATVAWYRAHPTWWEGLLAGM